MANAFVGRERHLRAAAGVIDDVVAGHGSALVVTGEAGIGKTRFAREVAGLARARGVEVVWAAGWPAAGAPAYWPWPQVLEHVAPEAAVPLDADPDSADRERFDRFREVAELLWGRAAQTPLLLVIDDVQAVDADGLLLTRFIAQSAPSHPVLLLLTQRTGPGSSSASVDLLEHVGRSGTTVRLDELDPEEVAALIAGHGEVANDALVRRVAELTGGVPFLVEVVLDAGLHRGPGPVPDPVRRLVADHLAGLAEVERQAIEAAAVLGGEVVPASLAEVAGLDPAAALVACRAAEGVGLLRTTAATSFAFPHELAREAVAATVDAGRLAELHRSALEALGDGPTTPEIANQRAHHALELVRCDTDATGLAIDTVRDGARILLAHGAPETAVDLLEAALGVQEAAPDGPDVALLVELGSALLETGRLASSRVAFGRALDADPDADPTLRARAALGLGGVWVLEHRSPDDWAFYLDVLRRALDAVGDDPALAAALRLRLTAERAAVGEVAVEEVLWVMDELRALGSPGDLVAGLSILHHLMMGPDHAGARVGLADELVGRSRGLGDDLHLVMGLLWRAADEVLLGHDAERSLAEVRVRADSLGMQAILFVVDAFDVMFRLRAGELDAAEAAALDCHARGVAVGDVDAETYLAAHLLTAHWYRGTAPALLDVARATASSTVTPVGNPVFTAVVAALAAEAGDVDAAERALDLVGRDRLGDLLVGSTWLVTMFCLVEAASHLGDADLAEAVYDLLLPHEALPIMSAIGVSCFGSTARTLGVAARTAGRIDDAVAHLEAAVAENQRLANRPMTAIARADLAAALLSRRRPGDRERASALVARALEGAERLGLTGRVEAWSELQRRCTDGHRAMATLEQRDGSWFIRCGDEEARLSHSAGLGHLARLLESPGVEIPVGDLVGGDIFTAPQELLDPTAREQLRRRVADLESGLDTAVLRGDHAGAARLQAELDELLAHLKAAVGLAGRSRRFDDSSERARTSVQKAIRRALVAVSAGCPQLGEALVASVKTGYRCRYEPTAGAPARWDVRRG